MDFIHKVADYFSPHSPTNEEHHIFDPDELIDRPDDVTASAPAVMEQPAEAASRRGDGRPARNRKKPEPYTASFVLKAKPLREVQGRRRDDVGGGDQENALVSSQGSQMSLSSSQGSVVDPSSILGVPMSLASFNLSVTLKPENHPNAKGTTIVMGAVGPRTRKRGKEMIDSGNDVQSQGLLQRSEMGTDVPGPSLELLGRDNYDDFNLNAEPNEVDTSSQRTTRSGGKAGGRQRSSSPHVRIVDITEEKEAAEEAASPPKGRGRRKSTTPQPAERDEQDETPEKGRNRKSGSTPPSFQLSETPKSAGPQKYGRGRKSKVDESAELPQPQATDSTPKRRGGRKASLTPSPPTPPQSSLETIFDESMLTPEAEPGSGRGRKRTPTPQSSPPAQQQVSETPMATRGRKKSASPPAEEAQPQAKQRKIRRPDDDQESTLTDGSDKFFPAREDLPTLPFVPLDEMAKREIQKEQEQQQAPKSRGKQPPSAGKQAPKRRAPADDTVTRSKMTDDMISSGRGGKRSAFRKKPQRKSEKAGTVFPVARVHRMLRERESNRMRVGVGAAVYACAAVEYLVAEVLEISGMVAKGEKKRRINPHHINRCIKGDAELDQLFGAAIIPEGGHEPYIHPALLPKKMPGKTELSPSDHEPTTRKKAPVTPN